MWANEYKIKNIYTGRGEFDADLLESFNAFCVENDIKTGHISAIGAVKNIKLGYFDQDAKKYVQSADIAHKAPFEIVHCTGNVSLKDDKPFCHLHIVVSDREGNCWGGHLLAGVQIYALEFTIFSLDGKELKRGMDEATRLPLWVN